MSKYDPLWDYIKQQSESQFELTFSEIGVILGFPLDHSFLMYKKELLLYGYRVRKIFLKERKIIFERSIDI